MPSFRLIPSGEPSSYIDFVAPDASTALNIASSRHIDDADIYQDAHYAFSVRRSGLNGGCWVIQTKAELVTPPLRETLHEIV